MTHEFPSNSAATEGAAKSPVSYLEAVHALGFGVTDEHAVSNIIERGMESTVVNRLYELGAEEAEVRGMLAFPDRGTLTPEDTAVIVRVAHVLCRATALHGDRASALAWLHTPEASLGNQSPLTAAAGSDDAVNRIEALLLSMPDKASNESANQTPDEDQENISHAA